MEHTPKNILLRAVLRKEGDAEGEKKKETGRADTGTDPIS